MGFASIFPTSNDPLRPRHSKWGPDQELVDDIAALLSGEGQRCAACRQVVFKTFLREHEHRQVCPDCHPEGPTPEMRRLVH
jgi:hypothetical protein